MSGSSSPSSVFPPNGVPPVQHNPQHNITLSRTLRRRILSIARYLVHLYILYRHFFTAITNIIDSMTYPLATSPRAVCDMYCLLLLFSYFTLYIIL